MAENKNLKNNEKTGEVFLPWLIEHKGQLFLVFVTLFMLLLLVNQGGAEDLSRTTIWVFRGIGLLGFLFFYLLEYSRNDLKGLPLPSSRQGILKWLSYILVIFLIVNISTTSIHQTALAESLNFLMILALVLLVSFYADTRDRINTIIYIIGGIALFAAASGLIQYIRFGASSPLGSFFEWHNPAGGYFAAVLMIFLACLFTQSPTRSGGRFGWIGSILILAALIFTLSRGAWVAMILAAFWLLILLGVKRTYNRTSSLIAVGLVVLSVILIVTIGGRSFLEPVYHRIVSFTATKDFSIEGRENFYRGAIQIFQDHQNTGTGLGSFGYVYPQYQDDPRHYAKDPHSFYLRMAAEGGIPGIIMVVFIFWGYFYLLREFFRNRDKEINAISAGIIAALTAGLLHLAIDFDDTFPFILLNLGVLWVLGLNLLNPVKIVEAPADEETPPLVNVTVKGSSIILMLLVFGGLTISGFLYYSHSYSQKGNDFMKTENWSDAEEAFADSLRYYPYNIDALTERPRTLLFMYAEERMSETGSESDAERYLAQAIYASEQAKKRVPFYSKSYYVSGKVNFQSNKAANLKQAIEDFETALMKDPNNSPRYYFDTALAYWSLFDLSNTELETRFRYIVDEFKRTYPYDRIEEYARTRVDWIDFLPTTWQDMLMLEAQHYKIKGMTDKAIENVQKALEIEELRKKIFDETPEEMRNEVGLTEFESRRVMFDQALSGLMNESSPE